MTNSSESKAFKKAAGKPAKPKKTKRKAPPPVSVRLTHDEYDRLKLDAGALTMAAYIRLMVFGEQEVKASRKGYEKKQRSPSSELMMAGQLLGKLGESGLSSSLSDIAQAAKLGTLPLSDDAQDDLRGARQSLEDIKLLLIAALGVKVR